MSIGYFYLLLETGDYLLLEDGGKLIIGEFIFITPFDQTFAIAAEIRIYSVPG
jgi:hypothetical protein